MNNSLIIEKKGKCKLLQSIPVEWMLTLIWSAFCLYVSLTYPPSITGDGAYYYAMVKGIIANASPAITPEIIEQVKQATGISPTWLVLNAGSTLYGVHFFAYSLTIAPFLWLFDIIGVTELKAFQFTNVIFSISTILFVLSRRKIPRSSRLFITFGFGLSVSLYYLQWTHPEIFTASLVLIACILYVEGRLGLASVVAAIGSLQNPSAIALSLICGLLWLCNLLAELKDKKTLTKHSGHLLLFFISICIFLTPVLWSAIKFSTFNPIVKLGYIDYSLISFDRLFSIFFDVNQGIAFGLPLVSCTVLAIIFTYSNEKLTKGKLLVFASILMAIPTLAQTNWNSGASVIIRYGAWISMPLLVWSATAVPPLWKNIWPRSIIILGGILQILVLLTYGGFTLAKIPSNIEVRTVASKIWSIYPGLYNPIPEIFAERMRHIEFGILPVPIIFSSDGAFQKVLTNTRDKLAVYQQLCKGAEPKGVNSVSIHTLEKGYYYLNGKVVCEYKPGVPIEFSTGSIFSGALLASGWSVQESSGVWSDGDSSVLFLPPLDPTKEYELRFDAYVYLDDTRPEQTIQVFSKNKNIISFNVTRSNQELKGAIRLPLDAKSIRFDFGKVTRPSIGDHRLLGLYLKTITLSELN